MRDQRRTEQGVARGLVELLRAQRTGDRGYQALGVIHMVLFGGGIAASALSDGADPVVSVLGGIGVALFTGLMFAHLADYHGNGPGDGRLVGEDRE